MAVVVLRLERELTALEASRLQDLRDIEQWKSREMAKLRAEVEATQREASQVALVERLRAQNQRLSSSNLTIQRECEALDQSNLRLLRDLESTENEIQRLRDDVARIERSNEQWTSINEMYADQADKYGPAMRELAEMTAVEKHKNSLIQRTMVRVLEKVEQADQGKGSEPTENVTSSTGPAPAPSLFHVALALAAEAPWSQRCGEMPVLALGVACQLQ
jgi:predicted RNase H-like nuclease (RuvC/YqgF family)